MAEDAKTVAAATPDTTSTLIKSVAKPEPVRKQGLMIAGLKLSQFVTNRWSITVPVNVAYERLFENDYWGMVSNKLQPADIIEVHAEDGSYYAQLYVRASGKGGATVAEISKTTLVGASDQKAVAANSGLSVKWRGPTTENRWSIMRGNTVIQGGFQTPELAWQAAGQRASEFAA